MSPNSLALLDETHTFPCPYAFKAIGENSAVFVERVTHAVAQLLGEFATLKITTRQSAGGKHVSVALNIQAENAAQVLLIYDALRAVQGIRFIL